MVPAWLALKILLLSECENKLILMAYKNLLYTGQTLLQMKTVTTFFYI